MYIQARIPIEDSSHRLSTGEEDPEAGRFGLSAGDPIRRQLATGIFAEDLDDWNSLSFDLEQVLAEAQEGAPTVSFEALQVSVLVISNPLAEHNLCDVTVQLYLVPFFPFACHLQADKGEGWLRNRQHLYACPIFL